MNPGWEGSGMIFLKHERSFLGQRSPRRCVGIARMQSGSVLPGAVATKDDGRISNNPYLDSGLKVVDSGRRIDVAGS